MLKTKKERIIRAILYITLIHYQTTKANVSDIHGNYVSIVFQPQSHSYIITIHYTSIPIGEYRKVKVKYYNKKKAMALFEYIKNGGAIFPGKHSIEQQEKPHPEKKQPF